MPTGICKFSQKDKKLFYWYVEELQKLLGKYEINAELTIYDICDADCTEKVRDSRKKMARILRETGLPQMDHRIGARKERSGALANQIQGEKL